VLFADEKDKPIREDCPLDWRHGPEATIWQAKPYEDECESQEEMFEMRNAKCGMRNEISKN
jgi:hypothetical protein